MWEKVEVPKEDAQKIKDDWEIYIKRKAKFLLDENIDSAIAQVLNNSGYSAVHVETEKLKGKPDEKIFNFARKKELILVTTNTKHFWPDNNKIPLKTSPGIICLECDPSDINQIVSSLSYICLYLGKSAKLFSGAKIKITKKEIIYKFLGSSKVEYMKIDLKTGDVYIKK